MNRNNTQKLSKVKSQLRKRILLKRSILAKSFVGRQSQVITEKLLLEVKKNSPGTILVYLSVNNEVGTSELIRRLVANHIKIVVPKYFVSSGDYQLVEPGNLKKLEEGPFGIPQPKSSETINLKSVDVAILPAVAFDKKGVRLGYGKGIFDKLLAKSRAYKIGLAYDFQIVEKLPREKHDLVMDMLVTEKRVIKVHG